MAVAVCSNAKPISIAAVVTMGGNCESFHFAHLFIHASCHLLGQLDCDCVCAAMDKVTQGGSVMKGKNKHKRPQLFAPPAGPTEPAQNRASNCAPPLRLDFHFDSNARAVLFTCTCLPLIGCMKCTQRVSWEVALCCCNRRNRNFDTFTTALLPFECSGVT